MQGRLKLAAVMHLLQPQVQPALRLWPNKPRGQLIAFQLTCGTLTQSSWCILALWYTAKATHTHTLASVPLSILLHYLRRAMIDAPMLSCGSCQSRQACQSLFDQARLPLQTAWCLLWMVVQ